jgi:hypothetical protein
VRGSFEENERRRCHLYLTTREEDAIFTLQQGKKMPSLLYNKGRRCHLYFTTREEDAIFTLQQGKKMPSLQCTV